MRRFDGRWMALLGYAAWALFVNAVNVWLITPMVEDYALFGVIGLFVLILLFVVSIPPQWRRRWIVLTLFSLLLGNGIASLATFPAGAMVGGALLMTCGLMALAWIFARVRLLGMAAAAVAVFLANLWLPMSEWPFLTHFDVVYYGRLRLNPADMTAPPFVVVHTRSGEAVLSLTNVVEHRDELLSTAKTLGQHPNDLNDLLVNYGHRYEFVEIRQTDGRFVEVSPPPEDLAAVDPNGLVRSFFPFTRAGWMLENGKLVQFMDPTVDPRQAVRLTFDTANLPADVLNLAQATRQQEIADWRDVLRQLGVRPLAPTLAIDGGRLVGRIDGTRVNVPVAGTAVVGYGAFTAPGARQVLVEGANVLQVVSLTPAPGRVVATYRSSARMPLPNDIVIGPVDNSGRDAVFVNTSPAFILQVEANGTWRKLYTATSPTMRFEAALKLDHDQYPEIITDDPSLLRDNPIRYFSSYTYRDGQLYRNWRVYHTNVVNVTPVQFTKGGPTYVIAGVYASGKFVVLKRHDLPVVPVTSALLAAVLAAGWVLRWRARGANQG
ncbi:hypothetical protein GCM10010885_00600 [Alicyclobacillus cellulosilyticus]|uniref:Uncharacterized protein n=1 Tax=Alicyclobacillus cellulosilyticus TaxID=1003997 RepID=A0A917K0M0_9BACL|nr:US12 family protein [Alicyclobacillus cellulosilyticus]GGI94971.1 hypothetical protein GCM10010885_00600 [Alicyclobacillus cellulosilyticus]